MKLKYEFPFMGKDHDDASDNVSVSDDADNLYENILDLILPEFNRWMKDITHMTSYKSKTHVTHSLRRFIRIFFEAVLNKVYTIKFCFFSCSILGLICCTFLKGRNLSLYLHNSNVASSCSELHILEHVEIQ